MAEVSAIVRSEYHPALGFIELSATITENHTREADVSDHALETGAQVTDHRRKRPIELQMDAIIGEPDTREKKESEDPTGDETQRKYDALLEMFESGEPFQVLTSIAIYESMTFKRLSVVRDSKTGNSVRFQASLSEVRFADSEVVEVKSIPADQPKTSGKVDQGKKVTKPAPPKVAEDIGIAESFKGSVISGLRSLVGP